MTEKITLNKQSAPCSEDPNYSFTFCIFLYIARSVGCQISWIHSGMDQNYPECSTPDQIIAYDTQLGRVESMSGFDLTNMTKCPVSCRVRYFSFDDCKSVEATWKHDWSSAFYLAPSKTEFRQEKEFLVFDKSDTINGIGGAMGLFLGWSVLYLIHQLSSIVKIVLGWLKKY